MSNADEGSEYSEEFLREINESYLNEYTPKLITPDKLYLEMRLLKDYKLGAAMCDIITQPDVIAAQKYQYIQEHLLAYSKRSFDDFAYYFPDLGYTNKDLNEKIYDPKMSDMIFRVSPSTNFMRTLRAQLRVNINHSAVAEKVTRHNRDGRTISTAPSIHIVINTYPLVLSRAIIDGLGQYLSGHLNCDIEFMCKDPRHLSIAFLKSIDEIYTYYLKNLLDNDTTRAFFEHLNYMEKRVFGVKLFGYTVDPKYNIETDMEYTERALGLLMDFKYIETSMVSPEVPKPPKEESSS